MTPDAMRDYAGRYALASSTFQVSLFVEDGRLIATRPGVPAFELVPTQPNVFAPTIDAPAFIFERDSSGAVTTLVVGGTRLVRAR
jgi:hypothetical protein